MNDGGELLYCLALHLRAASTVLVPLCLASWRAISKPMPLFAPVTTAVKRGMLVCEQEEVHLSKHASMKKKKRKKSMPVGRDKGSQRGMARGPLTGYRASMSKSAWAQVPAATPVAPQGWACLVKQFTPLALPCTLEAPRK
jgi:hypothetical protein